MTNKQFEKLLRKASDEPIAIYTASMPTTMSNTYTAANLIQR